MATTGKIDIEGTNIDLNGTTYTSNDGDIEFTGPVDLHANVTVDSDKDNDSVDGKIIFNSTVDAATAGTQSLTLDADRGAVDLKGAVGGTAKLASLTVDGGQIDVNSVATTGAIDIEGTNIDLNGATYTSDDGDIKFTGPVDLTVNVSVDSDKDDDATDGDITFTSTVNGSKTLTLDTDGGAVDLQGTVGGSTKLMSLTVDGGQIDLASVATTGAIDIEGTNIDLNGAAYRSNDGNITFTGPVDLTVNARVDSDADNDATDGTITFTSTVDGAKSLTLDAGSGDVDLKNAVGGTTKLASLTVDGGQIDVSTVATTGAIDIDGTNIDLNGATYESDDGNIVFRGPVDLHTDVTVDSDKDSDNSDGSIRFVSTLDGAYDLTLNADTGNIDFVGDVGSVDKLMTLTVTKAHNVTVHASMKVDTFTQLAGTGKTDFGFSTLNADTIVEVSTEDIIGTIIGPDADVTLTAAEDIMVTVDVKSLTIEATNSQVDGKIDGDGGQTGADKIIINNRGSGSYKFG